MFIIYHLYNISINLNKSYSIKADNISKNLSFIKPIRGEILDKNGKLLAINKIGFNIKINPNLDIKGEKFNKIINLIMKSFPYENKINLIKKYSKKKSKYNHKFIQIIDFIPYKIIINKLIEFSILKDDIKIEHTFKRYYPYADLTAHIIGYIGDSNKKDNKLNKTVKEIGIVGKTGLEKQYNNTIQGELGIKITRVNALNKEVEKLSHKKPKDNINLHLTLDIKLQQKIDELMKGKSGVAIVMNVNGKILSSVSLPSFNPNSFIEGFNKEEWANIRNDINQPLNNKAINAAYPPGSTIKMGVALSLFNQKIFDTNEKCQGAILVGKKNRKFRCWKRWGHKEVNLIKSIRESCDVFFYKKSLQTGINTISKVLNNLGLGVKTGIDLPKESSGLIPNREWKRKKYNRPWYSGDTLNTSIGQGYSKVTPLQLAIYTSFLATNKLPIPYFVSKISNKVIKPKYKDVNIDINQYFLKQVRLGMYDVCNHKKGTANRYLSNLPIVVAGKTGTSQVVSIPQEVIKRQKEEEMKYFKRSHAWLTSYAPYKNPKYIVTVLIEHGGHGGSSAGPIVAEIYKWLYDNKYFNN